MAAKEMPVLHWNDLDAGSAGPRPESSQREGNRLEFGIGRSGEYHPTQSVSSANVVSRRHSTPSLLGGRIRAGRLQGCGNHHAMRVLPPVLQSESRCRMNARGVVTIIGLIVTATVGFAQEKPTIKEAPIPRVNASDGKEMFAHYCSPCHGKEGRGDGPAAAALKRAPADLTTLTSRYSGKFPDVRVKRYIEGLDEVPAHGTRDMPIWGPLFRALSPDTAALRVEALTAHLRSIQR